MTGIMDLKLNVVCLNPHTVSIIIEATVQGAGVAMAVPGEPVLPVTYNYSEVILCDIHPFAFQYFRYHK